MDHIQPYLDYFALHPGWALAIIFLISFGEALLVIGLVVPSTAVLVGAGALVGTGKLEFWPVMIATTLGCVLGDQVSFWAGRIFGDRLRNLWPLSIYPHLVAKGEDFMKAHGGKSIALGRFVPGVKAVVPGIAGMFGMGQLSFLSINVASGIVWSIVHLVPGILVGQALSLAGELSGRLLLILLVLITILAVAGWLIRILAASVMPYRKAIQGHIAAWARARGSKPMRRFSRAIAPENPRSILLFIPIILSPIFVLILIDIVSGRILQNAVGNLDYSIFNLFSELRSAPGDELLIRITMIGDDIILFSLIAGATAWLFIKRAWRTAAILVATALAAKLLMLSINYYVDRHMFTDPPIASALQFPTFPSNHALMAAVVFGSLALLLSRSMNRWAGALVTSTCSLIVIAIAFSRLYLGVNWLSDVAGALLLAAVIITLFGVANATWPSRRVKPLGLLASSFAALVVASTIHISSYYEQSEDHYAATDKRIVYNLADWINTGWQTNQTRRVDLSGKPEEVFVVQWVGSLPQIQDVLKSSGFRLLPKWTWRDAFHYLDPHAPLDKLPPRPALHQGLKAKITGVESGQGLNGGLLTVRVFGSNAVIGDQNSNPVYLVSLTREVLHPRFNLFSVPSDSPASVEDLQAFIATLKSNSSVQTLADKLLGGLPVEIMGGKL